jgi:hypothetical protein
MTTPYTAGQFVWCKFPYRENPTQPGPEVHVGYIAAVDKRDPKNPVLSVVYTTSSPGRIARNEDRPGYIAIDEKTARGMNQKPFMIEANQIALLPSDRRFFPELGLPGNGIVSRAPKSLHKTIIDEMRAAIKRRYAYLDILGPKVRRNQTKPLSDEPADPVKQKIQSLKGSTVQKSDETGPTGKPILTLRPGGPS